MSVSFMRQALLMAELAVENAEVPVGSVIVDHKIGTVLAENFNRTIELCDPTAHAEILVIREVANRCQTLFLDDCDIYVTLEPCKMCMYAIERVKIRRVYFGAYRDDFSPRIDSNDGKSSSDRKCECCLKDECGFGDDLSYFKKNLNGNSEFRSYRSNNEVTNHRICNKPKFENSKTEIYGEFLGRESKKIERGVDGGCVSSHHRFNEGRTDHRICNKPKFENSKMEIYGGFLERESKEMLRSFFRDCRKKK